MPSRPLVASTVRAFAALACALGALAVATPVRAQGFGGALPPPGEPEPEATPTPAPSANAPPRLLHFVQADYPAEARAAGVEGAVVLALTLDAQGHVTNATVVQGIGHGLDEAAVDAARRFEFTPGRMNGQNVAAQLRYRYRFVLQPSTAAAGQAPAAEPAAVVEGVVRDGQNHPVASAHVTVGVGGSAGSEQPTDAQGRFHVELHALGAVRVTIMAPGFLAFHADERVFDRDDLRLIYRLTPVTAAAATAHPVRRSEHGDDESEATVRAQRPPREVDRETLDRSEIERIPGTGGDALRAIQNLPGLARAPFLSGALIVRGSSPQDTQIFADGTPIPLIYHFGGLTSVIPTEMLDRIDFYPGNFSSQFGRAMGGIVDVGLRSPRRRGCHGVANINVIDAGIFAECAVTPNLSFAVAIRRSYIDVFLNAILSHVPSISVTAAPVYYDYQAVLEWRPNAHNRFRLAVFGDDDELSLIFGRAQRFGDTHISGVSFGERFHLAQLSWWHDILPGVTGRAMISGGFTGIGLNAGDSLNLAINTFPFTLRYELAARISQFARLNAGLDMNVGPATVDLTVNRMGGSQGSLAVGTNTTTYFLQPATYAELEITPVPHLRLVPGVRFDWFEEIHAGVVSPRASARWEFIPTWAIKGGVGLFTQPPQFQESSNAPNAFFPGQTLGNPHLIPQRATHYALGMEHDFSRWISLSVEGFYKTLSDLVESVPTSTLLQHPGTAPYNNDGLGRVYGLEVLLRHRPSEHFFGWLAYTLMRSERQDAPGQPWHLYQYDQTHILTLIASYTIAAGWQVGARFRYVTGTPVTPVVGSFYNSDSSSYIPINGPVNSARAADFHQLDLRVDKTWRFSWGRVGVFLEVLNVYNQQNQEGMQYNFNYTQSQPVTGLPIIPNLGIRGEL